MPTAKALSCKENRSLCEPRLVANSPHALSVGSTQSELLLARESRANQAAEDGAFATIRGALA